MNLTRETKLGMAVAGSFVCLLGVLVGRKMFAEDVAVAAPQAPVAVAAATPPVKEKPAPTITPPPPAPPAVPAGMVKEHGSIQLTSATVAEPPKPLPREVRQTPDLNPPPVPAVPMPPAAPESKQTAQPIPVISEQQVEAPTPPALTPKQQQEPAGDLISNQIQHQLELARQQEQQPPPMPGMLTEGENPTAKGESVQLVQGPTPPVPPPPSAPAPAASVPVPPAPEAKTPPAAGPTPPPVPVPAPATRGEAPSVPAPPATPSGSPPVPPAPSVPLAPAPSPMPVRTEVPPVPAPQNQQNPSVPSVPAPSNPVPVPVAPPTPAAPGKPEGPPAAAPTAPVTGQAVAPSAPVTPPNPLPGVPVSPPAVPAPAPTEAQLQRPTPTPPVPAASGEKPASPPATTVKIPGPGDMPPLGGKINVPAPAPEPQTAAPAVNLQQTPPPVVGAAPPVSTRPITVPQPSAAPGIKQLSHKMYVVEPGDTSFEAISAKQYYSPVYGRALLLYNREKVPNSPHREAFAQDPPRLEPGQRVAIPPAPLLESLYPGEKGKLSSSAPLGSARTAPPPPEGSGNPTPRLAPPEPVQPANKGLVAANPATTHTVRGQGEHLYEIARDRLGDGRRWIEIWRLNPQIRDNNGIVPGGIVLQLPTTSRAGS